MILADQWRPTQRFDATLHVLAVARPRGLAARRLPRLHRLGRVPGASCASSAATPSRRVATGLVRLHLAEPLPLMPGDRFVLRESGRDETVGGGEVLDVAPVLPASKAGPDRSVDRVIAERGWITVDDLEALTGERREPTLGHVVVSPGVAASDQRRRSGAYRGGGRPGARRRRTRRSTNAWSPATLDGIVVDVGTGTSRRHPRSAR